MQVKNSIFWSGLSLVWLGLIFVLLLMPTDGLSDYTPHLCEGFDKVVHGVLFGIWAGLLCLASLERYQEIRYRSILLLIVVMAILTELFQGMTSIRTCDPMDALADVVGAILFLFAINYWKGTSV